MATRIMPGHIANRLAAELCPFAPTAPAAPLWASWRAAQVAQSAHAQQIGHARARAEELRRVLRRADLADRRDLATAEAAELAALGPQIDALAEQGRALAAQTRRAEDALWSAVLNGAELLPLAAMPA